MNNKTIHYELRRDLGMFGATMMGLGSILGTGVFVSIGFAAGVTGPSVIFAIMLAALVAICNALSSAQLAALYLPKEQRLYPNVIALTGLISCLFLAFWVPLIIWLSGLLLITLGLIWHRFHRYYLKANEMELNEWLKAYKQIELNNEKNLQFFLDKHSTKEGTWGNLTVHDGTIEFAFLDGHENELSHLTLTPKSPALAIPPASWHKIASTSAEFKATLQFYCQPHRYFEKKYRLTSIHHDLWYIYQTYLQEREKMAILDVGCGSGRNPLYFALSGHNIITVDKNENY